MIDRANTSGSWPAGQCARALVAKELRLKFGTVVNGRQDLLFGGNTAPTFGSQRS